MLHQKRDDVIEDVVIALTAIAVQHAFQADVICQEQLFAESAAYDFGGKAYSF